MKNINATVCDILSTYEGRLLRHDRGAEFRTYVMYDMLGDDKDQRRLVLDAAVRQVGLETVKNDALCYFKKMRRDDWISTMMQVRYNRRNMEEYIPNMSRRLIDMIKGDLGSADLEREFINSGKYSAQRRKILSNIRKCRTKRDLLEIFERDPHRPMIVAFLRHVIGA